MFHFYVYNALKCFLFFCRGPIYLNLRLRAANSFADNIFFFRIWVFSNIHDVFHHVSKFFYPKSFFIERTLFTIFRSYQPVILYKLIGMFSFSQTRSSLEEKYFYGGILIGTTFVLIFMNHHINLELSRIGMRIRVACSSLVYRKVSKIVSFKKCQDLVFPWIHYYSSGTQIMAISKAW